MRACGASSCFCNGSCGNGQDLYRAGIRHVAVATRRCGAGDSLASCRRGGGEARLPAWRHAREGRSLPASHLRPAASMVRQDGDRATLGARKVGNRPALLHARTHHRKRLYAIRRGAKHLAAADEDGADAIGNGIAHRRHGRPFSNRPACNKRQRARRCRTTPQVYRALRALLKARGRAPSLDRKGVAGLRTLQARP